MPDSAREWTRAGLALREAARVYDQPGSILPAAAGAASKGGFAAGANWMGLVMGELRGEPARKMDARRAHRLGCIKYALALLAGAPALGAAIWWHPLALIGFPLGFYAVESRLAFVFPLALDGADRPLAASWRWTAPLPWLDLTFAIMRLATVMLVGGLLGWGFLRSWCLGCAAVIARYESDPRVAA